MAVVTPSRSSNDASVLEHQNHNLKLPLAVPVRVQLQVVHWQPPSQAEPTGIPSA